MAHFGSLAKYQGSAGAPYLNAEEDPGSSGAVTGMTAVGFQNSGIGAGLVNLGQCNVSEFGIALVPQPMGSQASAQSVCGITMIPLAPGIIFATLPPGTYEPQIANPGNTQALGFMAWDNTTGTGFYVTVSILDNGQAFVNGSAPASANGGVQFLGTYQPRVFRYA